MSEIKTYFLLVSGGGCVNSEFVRGDIIDLKKSFASLAHFGTYDEAKTDPEIGAILSDIEDVERCWSLGEFRHSGEQWHCYVAEVTNAQSIDNLETENAKLRQDIIELVELGTDQVVTEKIVAIEKENAKLKRHLAKARDGAEKIRLILIDNLNEPERRAFWLAVETKQDIEELNQGKEK